MTLIELLLSLLLSSGVMLAALALVNAYGYASNEISGARPLRSEAVNVHASVQKWLQDAQDIIAITTPLGNQLNINDPGVKESGLTRIFAWMGDRAGRVYDGEVAYDEIEAVVWEYDWDAGKVQQVDYTALNDLWGDWGSCSGCASDYNGDDVVDSQDLSILMNNWGSSNPAFVGTLKHYYYVNEDATPILDSDLNHDYLTANWFTADAVSETWSNHIYRFTAELLTDGTKSSAADVRITLLNFSDVRADPDAPSGVSVPPDYSIHVTGTPDHYIRAEGY